MPGKLDYIKKCYALYTALALFLVLGYRFSFSDSFALGNQIHEKEKKLEWLKEREKELPALKAKLADFENAYSKNDSISVRDKLTAGISDYAENNNCLVTEIPANSSFSNNNLNVQTNTFTIKGNFKHLLTLLLTLEQKYRYVSRIMSVRFYTTRDLQTHKKNLYLTLVTQSFEQKNK
jgi:hypothetical protein